MALVGQRRTPAFLPGECCTPSAHLYSFCLSLSLSLSLLILLFYACKSFDCMYVAGCTTCMPGTLGDQKRTLYILELELQSAVNWYEGSGNQTQVLWKRSVDSALSRISQPSLPPFSAPCPKHLHNALQSSIFLCAFYSLSDSACLLLWCYPCRRIYVMYVKSNLPK